MEEPLMTCRPTKLSLSLFLLLCFLPLFSGAGFHPSPVASAGDRFIQEKCNTTEFPHLCVASLSTFAPAIGDSMTMMAHAALNVSLKSARSTSAMIAGLSASSGDRMSPRVAGAVRDCVENLADSVDSLRLSLMEMGSLQGRSIWMKIDDIQTWVSAALTEENTCVEGFDDDGVDGSPVKAAVSAQVLSVAQLTSNALALINDLSPVP
ncbi:21 kDa protein [Apostasia shenzhenica]|uniref:21 kDa protein n=1 Tax=Apostasia shenzhenica TaxID=1088818 RepID=A0A2H9ZT76_9ASPA|nr:21 kDa protein [Apostasia shenzhenica]